MLFKFETLNAKFGSEPQENTKEKEKTLKSRMFMLQAVTTPEFRQFSEKYGIASNKQDIKAEILEKFQIFFLKAP